MVQKALVDKLSINFGSIKSAFRQVDSDKSGLIDADEFRRMLRNFNIEMEDADLGSLVQKITKGKRDEITYDDLGKFLRVDEKVFLDPSTTGIQLGNERVKPKAVVYHHWSPWKVQEIVADRMQACHGRMTRVFRGVDHNKSGRLDPKEIRLVRLKCVPNAPTGSDSGPARFLVSATSNCRTKISTS